MAWREVIVEALRRLTPRRPAANNLYIPRKLELIEQVGALLAAGETLRGLLIGPYGVGKTTALHRLAAGLRHRAAMISVQVDAPRQWRADLHRWRALARRFDGNGPPVLLVDGLHYLPLEEVPAAFGPGSPLCEDTMPSFIVVGPPGMLAMDPHTSRDPRFAQVWYLPPLHTVHDAENPRHPQLIPDDAGVSRLAAGMAQRLSGLSLFAEPEAALRRVAIASGGVPGHAVRLLREAALVAARSGPISDVHLEIGERALRRDLAGVLRLGDARTLRKVAVSRRFRGEARLVNAGLALAYEGPTRRHWAPHPLIWSEVS